MQTYGADIYATGTYGDEVVVVAVTRSSDVAVVREQSHVIVKERK